jgi:hypothetical protein
VVYVLQMMQPNIGRMGVDMGSGVSAIGQGSMSSGTGRVMPAGPGMGPGVTSQTGRGPSMTQSGQQMVGMVAGLPMNQAPPSSAGSVGGMPGGSMHGMGPMVMLAGGHAMGGVNQGVPMGIRAPLHPGIGALDSNSRPTYGARSPGVAMDGGLTAGSGMKPQGYGQAAHPVPPSQQQSQVFFLRISRIPEIFTCNADIVSCQLNAAKIC